MPDLIHPSEFDFDQYLDDALEPGPRADLEAHLAGCATCRERLERTRVWFQSLDGARNASFDEPVPRNLRTGVLAGLPSSLSASGSSRRISTALRWALPVQAVLAAVLLAVYIPTAWPAWQARFGSLIAMFATPDLLPSFTMVHAAWQSLLDLGRTPLPAAISAAQVYKILAGALVVWLLANGLIILPRRNR